VLTFGKAKTVNFLKLQLLDNLKVLMIEALIVGSVNKEEGIQLVNVLTS
jgi:hypothetical protein